MIIGLLLANMAMMISMFVYFQGRFDKIDDRFQKIDSRLTQIEKDILWIKFQHGHVPEESKEN